MIRSDIRKLSIKTLTAAQFAQLVQIEENCGLKPYTPDMLLACIDDLDTFAYFDGEKIGGFITVQRDCRYFGGSVYIANINVAKAYRGRGIAKKLMYRVYEYYAQACGDKLVSLDVMKTNQALKLYQKIGFQIMDIPSRNGDTDVVMAMPMAAFGAKLKELLTLTNGCSII